MDECCEFNCCTGYLEKYYQNRNTNKATINLTKKLNSTTTSTTSTNRKIYTLKKLFTSKKNTLMLFNKINNISYENVTKSKISANKLKEIEIILSKTLKPSNFTIKTIFLNTTIKNETEFKQSKDNKSKTFLLIITIVVMNTIVVLSLLIKFFFFL